MPAGPARRDRAAATGERDLRVAILDATEQLLDDHQFDELSVADVLEAAQVSRATFYFYFESKHAVLAELVRRAVAEGFEAARPWLGRADDEGPEPGVRHGIEEGARLWRAHAGVLRAIVENWRTDPALTEVWTDFMGAFTAATEQRIKQDQAAGLVASEGLDVHALSATLTWLGERLYYLAAIGQEPFSDETRLVGAMTRMWLGALYRQQPG